MLYDKLLKVNPHEQFVDADRAGSDVIRKSEDVHLYHLFLYVCRIFCVLVCET